MAYSKKICLLGEYSVGKTSLIRRFVDDRFDDSYISTIGVKVSRKHLVVQDTVDHLDITLLVWDLAGGEKFDHMMKTYYQGAAGALLVCDLTRLETAEALTHYATTFRAVNPGTPLVMVGNKVDLVDQRDVSDGQLAVIADAQQAPWFLSSAKTGIFVDTAFHTLAERMRRTS